MDIKPYLSANRELQRLKDGPLPAVVVLLAQLADPKYSDIPGDVKYEAIRLLAELAAINAETPHYG